MQRITIRNRNPQTVAVGNRSGQAIRIGNGYTISGEAEPYTGAVLVTPTAERQTLPTRNKCVPEDIVVEPIPQNYGLITYTGFEITVS